MASEQAFVASPIASAAGRVITAPFQFYTSGEDNLRITSVNSVTGVRLKIQARFIDGNGIIGANSWDQTPNTDRTVKQTDVGLGTGAILNLTVFASAGTPLQGQTFVIVQLIRGLGASAIVLGTLLQGYVTTTQQLAWPGSPIVSSTEGEPAVRFVGGTQPAPGAQVVETVPTGARWELATLALQLVSSAAVASRLPWISFWIGGTLLWQNASFFGQAASSTYVYTWAQTCRQDADNPNGVGASYFPIKNVLLAGHSLQTRCSGFQLGDQWGSPLYVVREWLEVN